MILSIIFENQLLPQAVEIPLFHGKYFMVGLNARHKNLSILPDLGNDTFWGLKMRVLSSLLRPEVMEFLPK